MFQNPHYITEGINQTFPSEMRSELWLMVARLPEPKDYLQIFRFFIKEGKQMVKHEQEKPPYEGLFCFTSSKPVEATVYIIDDGDHSTMLLAQEY